MQASDITNHLTNRRIRRRSMAGLAGAGAATALLTACGGSTTSTKSSNSTAPTQAAATPKPTAVANAVRTPVAAQEQPQRGGTGTFAVLAQMGNLHPKQVGGSTIALALAYDRLVNSIWPEGKYELSAASSVEQPDQTTVIFKIDPSAKFLPVAPVNGRAVTSDDIITSWTLYKDDPKGSGVKAVFTQFMDKLEGPDAATVKYTAKAPNAWILGPHALAANVPTAFAPKELVAGDQLQKVCAGSGAYMLDQFDPASTISFNRRPDGWHQDRPYVDRVVYKVITDATARKAALRSKQIDALAALDKTEADEFKTYGADMRVDREQNYPGTFFMRVDRPPFNDPRTWQAVYAALDVEGLIKQLALGDGEWSAPVPPHLAKWALPAAEIKQYYPNDPKKARDLLTAAGWDFNREVEYKYPNLPAENLFAQIFQQQLAAAGLKLKLIPQEPVTWSTDTYNNSNFQITSYQQLLTGGDANYYVQLWSTPGSGGGNKTLYSDAEIDTLVQQQQTEFDSQKQIALLLQLQRTILKKSAPIVNTHAPYTYTGRWNYWHPALASVWGWAGAAGQHGWMSART